jgi:glycogen synthase
MAQDFSWDAAAQRYIELYRDAMQARQAGSRDPRVG